MWLAHDLFKVTLPHFVMTGHFCQTILISGKKKKESFECE